MITERAVFDIKPGSEDDFVAAVNEAKRFPASTAGFHSLRLLRGVESPSTFILLIEWDSIDAHVQGFRESPDFGKWRELIGPFFASPPEMEHYAVAI